MRVESGPWESYFVQATTMNTTEIHKLAIISIMAQIVHQTTQKIHEQVVSVLWPMR